MHHVILVIHIILAISLIATVLLQRSEGGGLGIGGGSGGMGSFMSARGTANFLTRTTAILAACFMGTSLLLAIMASGGGASQGKSLLDMVQEAPATKMKVEDISADEAAKTMPSEQLPEAPVSR